MASLHVLKTGCTTCQQQRRFEVAAGAPLTAEGLEQVQAALAPLEGAKLDVLYSGPGEAQRQSAAIAGNLLRLRPREHEDLAELDFGLWQGLTFDELEQRQPRLYRQWVSNPSSVQPPEGESLEQAGARLRSTLTEILRRHREQRVLVVLGPMMAALLRCIVQDSSSDDLWQMMTDSAECFELEVDAQSLLQAKEQV